jgi:hypothetical protein
MDFGYMSFNCKMESLFNYFIYFTIIIWNTFWTYDVSLICSSSMMFTEKYVFYYKVAVYFFSFIFCIIVFYPTMDKFTDVIILTFRQLHLNVSFQEDTCSTFWLMALQFFFLYIGFMSTSFWQGKADTEDSSTMREESLDFWLFM